jgi:hypothetical protein
MMKGVEPQPPEPLEPGPSTYVGLFFIALATLMHEILLTRIFSATMVYHFAFVALSVAMFGMTVGALIVYLAPRTFRRDRLRDRMALVSTLFPVILVVSFLTELSIPFRTELSIVPIYAMAVTYLVISLPFVASGVVICLALTSFPRRIGRLYAVDLTGAAVGCVLLIAVLNLSDGPTAVLWVAALAGVGAIAFSTASSSRAVWRLALASTIVLALAASAHTMLVRRDAAVLRILYSKGVVESAPIYEKWNSHSRVRVLGNPHVDSPVMGWGLSSAAPAHRLRQLHLDIDAWAGTAMTNFNGDLRTLEHLKYDVTNIAYYLRPDRKVLVIGAGGGRDVLSALVFGARSVTAVDINKDIIATVNNRFGDFTGHLDRDPRVRFVNDEARSFVSGSPEHFSAIQISLIDTWAATAAGAFVLGENSLYTVEAWTTFLDHLTDDGLLSVSRWYFQQRPAELYRTTSLAVAALRRLGITNPRDHIAVVRNLRLSPSAVVNAPEGVGTIIVSRRRFNASELETLDREAARLKFEVPFSARVVTDETFARLADPNGLEQFLAAYPVNVTAPTDDSPFFFNMLRLRDIGNRALLDAGSLSHNMMAVATLGILLVIVTLLTTLCILLPLWLTRNRVPLEGSGPLLLFFVAIGVGFMLIETSQMQRLIIVLGHPTYGLTVVLFTLLLSSGLGSALTSAVNPARSGRWRLVALLVVLAMCGLATPALSRWSEPLSTTFRILAAVLLLFPAGLVMGMAFPLGMTLCSERIRSLRPWLWGLNGAASVLASVLGVCIALTWSISTAFWTGWACYVVALAAFLRAASLAHRVIEDDRQPARYLAPVHTAR